MLKIDASTGVLVSHTSAPRKRMFEDLETAAKAMREHGERTESIFRQSVDAEKNKADLLEKKFAEAMRKAKDAPDEASLSRDRSGLMLGNFDCGRIAVGVEICISPNARDLEQSFWWRARAGFRAILEGRYEFQGPDCSAKEERLWWLCRLAKARTTRASQVSFSEDADDSGTGSGMPRRALLPPAAPCW